MKYVLYLWPSFASVDHYLESNIEYSIHAAFRRTDVHRTFQKQTRSVNESGPSTFCILVYTTGTVVPGADLRCCARRTHKLRILLDARESQMLLDAIDDTTFSTSTCPISSGSRTSVANFERRLGRRQGTR